MRRILSKIGLRKEEQKDIRPSAYDLDVKLESYLDFDNGFFIEAGGNDGYAQSNTYYLEKAKNWNGLLVEGVPDLYDQCRKNRPNCRVVNCALVADDFPDPHIEMRFANLMSLVEGSMKSKAEQDEHIQAGVDVQKLKGSYTVTVPARTLESVLDEIPDLPTIDFFSLDVEGYELSVLKGLNLRKYRPRYILVEARYFDEVNQYLEAHSYTLRDKLTIHDYIYEDTRSR